MVIYLTARNDDDDDELTFIKNHLKLLESEAIECAAELEVPKEMRYDALAALHGEAFLGEKDASFFEVSPSLSFQSENDKEIEKMLPSQETNVRDLDKMHLDQEAEWIRLALQGDSDALEILCESYIGRVYSYFLRRVKNEADAEALTSDVFTRAIETLIRGRYEWQGKPFGAWLFSIANHALKNWERACKKQSTTSLEDLSSHQPLEEVEEDIREMLQAQGRQDTLWQLVRELPSTSQQIVLMLYADNLSFAEIAEHLQRSKNACRLLHYRALIQLKHLVSELDLRNNIRRDERKS